LYNFPGQNTTKGFNKLPIAEKVRIRDRQEDLRLATVIAYPLGCHCSSIDYLLGKVLGLSCRCGKWTLKTNSRSL
jgi:hypothetical protein